MAEKEADVRECECGSSDIRWRQLVAAKNEDNEISIYCDACDRSTKSYKGHPDQAHDNAMADWNNNKLVAS